MSNAAPLQQDTLSDRIRTLAAQGLKVRDISSLLNVHPQIVLRILEAQELGCNA